MTAAVDLRIEAIRVGLWYSAGPRIDLDTFLDVRGQVWEDQVRRTPNRPVLWFRTQLEGNR